MMNEKGFCLSLFRSRLSPAFRNCEMSALPILPAVYMILKQIISTKVVLSFSKRPLLMYL